MDSGVEWARFYNLENFEIPEQIRIRRQEILQGDTTSGSTFVKSSTWSTKESENNIYKLIILPSDIVYIKLDSDVDPFLNQLEVFESSLLFLLNFLFVFVKVCSL